MKRLTKRFVNNQTIIDAANINDIVDAINEIHFKIEYLYYQKTTLRRQQG